MSSMRTRQSLGSQISEALADYKQRGGAVRWSTRNTEDGRICYVATDAAGEEFGPEFTPGGMADWLNRSGYNIYIGKA